MRQDSEMILTWVTNCGCAHFQLNHIGVLCVPIGPAVLLPPWSVDQTHRITVMVFSQLILGLHLFYAVCVRACVCTLFLYWECTSSLTVHLTLESLTLRGKLGHGCGMCRLRRKQTPKVQADLRGTRRTAALSAPALSWAELKFEQSSGRF